MPSHLRFAAIAAAASLAVPAAAQVAEIGGRDVTGPVRMVAPMPPVPAHLAPGTPVRAADGSRLGLLERVASSFNGRLVLLVRGPDRMLHPMPSSHAVNGEGEIVLQDRTPKR